MKKKTKHQKSELIFGFHPIHELLRAKRRQVIQVYTTKPEPKAFRSLKSLIPAHVPITHVKRPYLTELAGSSEHQGIVAQVTPFGFQKHCFSPDKHPFIVMVDSVQDTRNLGAIIRSAYCTGASGIVITSKNCAPINASTIKASAGLLEYLPVYKTSTSAIAAQELKKAGYDLYMAALGGKDATTVTYSTPLCVVIGNEETGITPAVLQQGHHVTLPQQTAGISYNASVAAGILLFLVATQNNVISTNH